MEEHVHDGKHAPEDAGARQQHEDTDQERQNVRRDIDPGGERLRLMVSRGSEPEPDAAASIASVTRMVSAM
ncbi:MAG: hypothetical protein IPL60_18550 [Ardenticatenia bacterium]|nr:hypothetical protein [Ardenticatenia bacterium]